MRRALVAAMLALAVLAALSFTMLYSPQRLLRVGASAPEVSALDQNQVTRSLSAELGHPVVVYFYPKDHTPGCTKEACTYRDTWGEFAAAGIGVFGVSGDSLASKKRFAKDLDLPFPVLADPENVWAKAFGVRVIFGMTSRVTFLIDGEGKVAKVYPNVDPALNVLEVLSDARELERAKKR